MKILMIGDVVSQCGCEMVRTCLPQLKRQFGADVAIVNGENAAIGNGILPGSAEHLFASGADVITTGNHVFRRFEMYDYLASHEQIIRPANYRPDAPGNGVYLYDGGSFSLLVVNLMGTSFLDPLKNPFDTMDEILRQYDATYTVVDFHAEATGEKRALGFYLDGRVSAVFGTHTHVQTADAQILKNGTAYITDVGMTGPEHSALGVKPERVIERLRTNLPVRFEVDEKEPCVMGGVCVTLDKKTGRSTGIVSFLARIDAQTHKITVQTTAERS